MLKLFWAAGRPKRYADMSLQALLTVAVLTAAPQSTQPAPVVSTGVGVNGAAADDLPVSLERIQRALARLPAVRLDDKNRPVFRVEVFGKKPTIEDILGADYLKGPAPYGGMTHQEFLNMVTPRDVQGYAAFSNKEAAVVAATSVALQWALLKAIDEYQRAKSERDREAARKEVEEALAELARARQRAGLPPK